MTEEKKELNFDDLGEISGGYYYEDKGDKDKPHKVIDSKGDVLASFATKKEAEVYAREHNISDYKLSPWELKTFKKGYNALELERKAREYDAKRRMQGHRIDDIKIDFSNYFNNKDKD